MYYHERVTRILCRLRFRLFLGLGLFLLRWPLPAATQASLLPTQLGTWRQVEWEQVDSTELERLVGTQAALLREYGCRRAERAAYYVPRGGDLLPGVVVCEMQDRSGAYGALTLLRARMGGTPVALGEAGIEGGIHNPAKLLTMFSVKFYQGNYLVLVGTPYGVTHELERLADHLRVQAGPQASLPTLPSYLPREGFIAGSDRYILGPLAMAEVAPLALGDWAGFAYGAEVEVGEYWLVVRNAKLLLLSYPTPQIAAARLSEFERLFNLNGTGNPRRALIYAKRSGTLIVMASGVASDVEAANLINRVRYDRELSWSEPSGGSGELPWGTTVANIITSTGVLLLFALISGIAFGLVRLVVKRLLPDKVFDRPEDTEIIRLDLTRRS